MVDASIRIYETKKMRVEIGGDRVLKVFKPRPGFKRRFQREKRALQLLEPVDAVPKLTGFSDRDMSLSMSRLQGRSASRFSDDSLRQIRQTVEEMLRHGVARHSLPERDILVDDTGKVGMVDFERVTIRSTEWSPIWQIAKRISRFHSLRLISRHNPAMLSPAEVRVLDAGVRIRTAFTLFRTAVDRVRNLWRDPPDKTRNEPAPQTSDPSANAQ